MPTVTQVVMPIALESMVNARGIHLYMMDNALGIQLRKLKRAAAPGQSVVVFSAAAVTEGVVYPEPQRKC